MTSSNLSCTFNCMLLMEYESLIITGHSGLLLLLFCSLVFLIVFDIDNFRWNTSLLQCT